MDTSSRNTIADEAIASPRPASTHAVPQTKSGLSAKAAKNRLYQVIWRWHFWMGLLIAPLLIVVAISGALYTFKEELEPFVYPSLSIVNSEVGTRLPYTTLYENVAAAHPEVELHSLFQPADPRRSVVFVTHEPTDDYGEIFINQYTGEVQGHFPIAGGIFATFLDAHRTLFLGEWGRVFVEVSTVWAIVSLVTGLYLWLPKQWNQVWGVWLPRLRGSRRVILRDLHTVPAIWFGLFALVIMVSGLCFSIGTGQAWLISGAVTGGFPDAYISPPVSVVQPNVEPISIDEAAAIYAQQGGTVEYTISFPDGDEGIYYIDAHLNDHPWQGRYLLLDQYSGAVLADLDWDEISLFTKFFLLGYPVHTGEIGGGPTKVVAFVATLLVGFMAGSGVLMWWWRRPVGHFGVPKTTSNTPIPAFVVVLTLVMAVLMPSMGITLILLFIGDLLIRFSRSIGGRLRKPT